MVHCEDFQVWILKFLLLCFEDIKTSRQQRADDSIVPRALHDLQKFNTDKNAYQTAAVTSHLFGISLTICYMIFILSLFNWTAVLRQLSSRGM